MDYYESRLILTGARAPWLIALGWFWGSLRALIHRRRPRVALRHQPVRPASGQLRRRPGAGRHVFLLKYFLSSQSAILWMGVLFFMSTAFYWIGFAAKSRRQRRRAHRLGPGLERRCSWP